MKLNAGLNRLWSTPCKLDNIQIKDEYLNSALTNEVHSELLSQVESVFDDYLKESLNLGLNNWKHKIQSWVNLYENNGMEYHTHHGSQISAVYYLMNEGGGEITFHDPRHFAARGYDMKFRKLFEPLVHNPMAGEIIVFPSYLYHTVRPAKGKRISIPFDLFLFDDD